VTNIAFQFSQERSVYVRKQLLRWFRQFYGERMRGNGY